MTTLQLVADGWRRQFGRIDRAWLALALLFAGLFVLVPEQGWQTAAFTGEALVEIAPYLVLAVATAAYAKASGADNLIARAFRGHIAVMILFAALMGALSPFCSCGVIPLIAALLAMGVPLAAVMAFWLSSPLMDPSMFVLTAGTLGTGFAVAKTMAAFGIGLLGGFGMLVLARTPAFADPLRPGVGNGSCAGGRIRAPKRVVWAFWREEARRNVFGRETVANVLFLGKWLTLAFALESLMLAYVPADLVGRVAGDGSVSSIVAAALVGVPLYLNGYAALPLIGGLIDSGMEPGAGMAFLLAGGVTCIPAAIAVYALTRRPVFLAYLGFALAGAVLAGLAYGLVA
jgi:uncharacterized membrane protein YraQ (UPF0718 family)